MADIPAQSIVDQLDAISRTRRLRDDESELLELAIKAVDRGQQHLRMTVRAAARLGVKRDMRQFRESSGLPDE